MGRERKEVYANRLRVSVDDMLNMAHIPTLNHMQSESRLHETQIYIS